MHKDILPSGCYPCRTGAEPSLCPAPVQNFPAQVHFYQIRTTVPSCQTPADAGTSEAPPPPSLDGRAEGARSNELCLDHSHHHPDVSGVEAGGPPLFRCHIYGSTSYQLHLFYIRI